MVMALIVDLFYGRRVHQSTPDYLIRPRISVRKEELQKLRHRTNRNRMRAVSFHNQHMTTDVFRTGKLKLCSAYVRSKVSGLAVIFIKDGAWARSRVVAFLWTPEIMRYPSDTQKTLPMMYFKTPVPSVLSMSLKVR